MPNEQTAKPEMKLSIETRQIGLELVRIQLAKLSSLEGFWELTGTGDTSAPINAGASMRGSPGGPYVSKNFRISFDPALLAIKRCI
jgi:hypothetical protein